MANVCSYECAKLVALSDGTLWPAEWGPTFQPTLWADVCDQDTNRPTRISRRNLGTPGRLSGDPLQAAVVEALLDPEFHGGGHVRVAETLISQVFIAGGRAFKLKRAIRLPYVDYTDLRRRRQMCRREVLLNKRLAPGIYLGVRSVKRDGTRFTLGPDEDAPDVVEYLVEMVEVPGSAMLSSRIASGIATAAELERVGRRIGEFHARAEVVRSEEAYLPSVRRWIDQRLQTLGDSRQLVDPARADRVGAAMHAYLDRRAKLIEERAERGLVRDGHGDLRLEHVVVWDPPQVMDCVEFDDDLRRVDTTADFAFLVMELLSVDREDLVDPLVRGYTSAGPDPGPADLLAFYVAAKALVRVEVNLNDALRNASPSAAAGSTARDLLELALAITWKFRRPELLVLAGSPGSGKTSLAEELRLRSGWDHLDSDLVRKELAGVPPLEPAPGTVYTPAYDERVYGELADRAAAAGKRGEGVIVEATFRRGDLRRSFAEVAGAAGIRPAFVLCDATPDAMRQRLMTAGPRTSDATVDVLESHLASGVDPWDEPIAGRVDTMRPVEQVADEVELILDRQPPERA